MADISVSWTSISSTRIDADSPLVEDLFEDMTDNALFNNEWMGDESGALYGTPKKHHAHANDGTAPIPGASGGTYMGLMTRVMPTISNANVHTAFGFKPEFGIMYQIEATTLDVDGFYTHDDVTPSAGTCLPMKGGIADPNKMQYLIVGGAEVDITVSSTMWAAGSVVEMLGLKSVDDMIKIDTYTGNGSTQSITGIGFEPDAVMIFCLKTNEDNGAPMMRATGFSGTTSRDFDGVWNAATGITSLDSDGFSVGNDSQVNESSDEYVYIALSNGTAAGESVFIDTYTGNGADDRELAGSDFDNGTLDFTPDVVIVIENDGTATKDPQWKTKAMQIYSSDINMANTAELVTNRVQRIIENGMELGTDTEVNGSGIDYSIIALKGGYRN